MIFMLQLEGECWKTLLGLKENVVTRICYRVFGHCIEFYNIYIYKMCVCVCVYYEVREATYECKPPLSLFSSHSNLITTLNQSQVKNCFKWLFQCHKKTSNPLHLCVPRLPNPQIPVMFIPPDLVRTLSIFASKLCLSTSFKC